MSNEPDPLLYTGLTKRDFFAAAAMQGLLSGRPDTGRNETLTTDTMAKVAGASVGFADALLEALAQREKS